MKNWCRENPLGQNMFENKKKNTFEEYLKHSGWNPMNNLRGENPLKQHTFKNT